jgi:hypothetical protein
VIRGAAGCAGEAAGLPRHPGRVASGGEAEADVARPPTRRCRNLRSLRERAQAGPERPRSPRGCLQPPLSASRPDPAQKIDPRTELLEGRKSWSPHSKGRVAPTFVASGDRPELSFSPHTRPPEPRGELNPLSTKRASGHVSRSAPLRPPPSLPRKRRTSADKSCGFRSVVDDGEPGAPRGTAATPETQDAWAREPPYARSC